MKKHAQPDERLDRLAASAESVMASIDASPPAVTFQGTFRLYISPTGRKYVTVVGTLADRPFAEVLAPVTDKPSWEATVQAAVEREAQPAV